MLTPFPAARGIEPLRRRAAAPLGALVLALSMPVWAAQPDDTVVTNPATGQTLRVSLDRVADFSKPTAGGGPELRAADTDEARRLKSGEAPEHRVSPLLLDEAGAPRALPGGVLIGLLPETDPDPARVQAEFARHGLQALRAVGERTWLIDSPAGLATLEVVRSLSATGRYAWVEPNWWKPRRTR